MKLNMKRALNYIDRWGPGVIALVTFFMVIGLAWQYDKQLVTINTRHQTQVKNLQRQIDKLEQIYRSQYNRDFVELRFKQLEERDRVLEEKLDFEAAKSQNLRERLMKEGRVN